jgi:nicotinamidase-related amidase
MRDQLPIPSFFDKENIGKIWRVPYQERAQQAKAWAKDHDISPTAQDNFKISLLLVDVQNTFCLPEFELFVGGRSGNGAVDDNNRLCQFIYHNLKYISTISATMDTHQAMQIFHSIYLIDDEGNHPDPYTLISVSDIQEGRWKFNPLIAESLKTTPEYGQDHLLYYAQKLAATQKYDLTIWPYHAMLGGIGHALVPAVEEAIFFHNIARYCQVEFAIKGSNPFTEHYSALSPEVYYGQDGKPLGERIDTFLRKTISSDAVIITGQAKSHCVSSTIADLLKNIIAYDPDLTKKVYLLEDCTSPVVIPGVIDYTDQADATFQEFSKAGMHIVRSTEPLSSWPQF